MKKLILLTLSFLSVYSFAASCPSGTELVKSISEDGTYFLFQCNIVINPPPEETSPNPDGYKPGWKIQEGSNFWSVDLDSPYWKTEEGSKEFQASKKRGSWIEKAASDYAKENPGVDPPISSYYATDGCGEGKQPANSSC